MLSDNAIKVLEKRYLLRDGNGNVIETPEMLFKRVANFLGDTDEEKQKFFTIMNELDFLPNSPCFTGAGTKIGALFACYVTPIEDSMSSIFETAKETALIFKSGGGVGINFSKLRPRNDKVHSTNGISSGPVTFMQIFNTITDVCKQGGVRRGALMGILECTAPDIMEFIDCKTNEKALNNFNISVGVSDKFMDAVKNDLPWELINPKNSEVVQTLPAKEIFRKIVKNAWLNGEPGLIFLDEINRHNPTPEQGKIESTNPCVVGSTRIMFPGHCPTMKDAAGPNYPYSVYSAIMDKRVTDGKSHHHNVTKIKRTAENAPIYKITMKSGLEIEATEYHKFFTVKQTNETKKNESKTFSYSEKKLEELSVGEMLMIYTTDTPMGVKPHRGTTEEKNNLRFGHFLASLYTQPNLWFRKNDEGGLVFSIDVKKIRKSEFGNIYLNLLRGFQSIYNKFCESNLAKLDSRIDQLIKVNYFKPRTHPYKNGFYSAEITDFLFNVLKINPMTDTKLPEILWNCEIGVLRGFFQMLFKVNGNVFKRKNCFWLTNFKSLSLLKDIQKRLLCMGVFGEIKPACYNKKQISGVTIASESHDLFIGPGRPIHTWLKNISFFRKDLDIMRSVFAKTLTEKTQDKSGYKDTIESITDTGKYEDVYCATGLEFNTLVLDGFVTGNCGESPLLPYEACCLGSINVSNFVDRSTYFDKDKLKKVIHTAIDFLNRMIDKNKYPLKKIETICKKNRKVGLGIMGWADALIKLGINYNSNKALAVAQDLMSFINTEATNYSILRNYQNQTVTAIAPTGTLSIIAGCSSGIEPNFAYVMKRRQADQEMFEVHPDFDKYIKRVYKDGDPRYQECIDHIFKNGITGAYLSEEEIEWFVTANQVPWDQHVKMQAVFQTNGVNLGCSKTVNMLNSATEDDVAKAFMLANDLHCKGTTVYRDGSRKGQVLSTGATEIPKNLNERPHVLSGDTYKVRTTEGKLYITVNKHNDKPVEVFSVPSTATGEILVLTEALCRLSSLALRHNVSLELIVKQLTSVRNQSLLSVPVNIANCLSQYVANADKPKCPECKADATVTEGCMKCTKCGWSKCG